ncbi:MAG: lamin tail domain-containing protein [Anaerolineae bacterium]|nr:lamin tail domain-containing protein [Anaerolineae bacterium]
MNRHTIREALTKPRFSILSVGLPVFAVLVIIVLQNAPMLTSLTSSTLAVPTKQQTLPILVNELLAHTDPPQKDTVELYNPNDQPVNIGGWYLSDAFDKPKKFKIAASTVVPARGYLLLDPDDFDLNARFIFSAEGEEVYLFAADAAGRLTGYYHGFSFGASTNGVSFGRHTTSTGEEVFAVQSALTLGGPNSEPQVGPIVISAIVHDPQKSGFAIELTNITTATVPLFDPAVPANTWHISGKGDFALPTGLTLGPKGALWVVAGEPADFRSAHGIADAVQIVGDYAYPPSGSGAKLTLAKPDPPNQNGVVPYVEVDVVGFSDTMPAQNKTAEKVTLRRLKLWGYGNDPANWNHE